MVSSEEVVLGDKPCCPCLPSLAPGVVMPEVQNRSAGCKTHLLTEMREALEEVDCRLLTTGCHAIRMHCVSSQHARCYSNFLGDAALTDTEGLNSHETTRLSA